MKERPPNGQHASKKSNALFQKNKTPTPAEECPPARSTAGIGAEIFRPVEPVRTVDPRTLKPPPSH
ncbi:hypothetical protein WI754_10415 [Pararhizobium sp. A13]